MDSQGRDKAVDLIKAAHAKPRDEIRRHFSAADLDALSKSPAARAAEREALALAERFLRERSGGGELKKSASRSALGAIRSVHKGERGQAALKALASLGLGVRETPVDPSVAAVAKALRKPRPFTGDFLTKTSVPPESSNAENDSVRADDGADEDFQDQGAPTDRATMFGPAHAASVRQIGNSQEPVAPDAAASASGDGVQNRPDVLEAIKTAMSVPLAVGELFRR